MFPFPFLIFIFWVIDIYLPVANLKNSLWYGPLWRACPFLVWIHALYSASSLVINSCSSLTQTNLPISYLRVRDGGWSHHYFSFLWKCNFFVGIDLMFCHPDLFQCFWDPWNRPSPSLLYHMCLFHCCYYPNSDSDFKERGSLYLLSFKNVCYHQWKSKRTFKVPWVLDLSDQKTPAIAGVYLKIMTIPSPLS